MILVMEGICQSCGKKFDPNEITYKQRKFYDKFYHGSLCKECWGVLTSIDDFPVDVSLTKEISFTGHSQSYCICYVDVVSSTENTAKIPNSKISKYYSIFLNALFIIARNFHGTIIKNLGDNLVFYFPQTSDSTNKPAFQDVLECCVAMIDAYSIINKQLYAEELPAVNYRISVDYGKVEIAWSSISQGDDLFGSTVNMCIKINAMAEPGGIVIGDGLYKVLKSLSFNDDYDFKEFVGYKRGFPYEYPICAVVRKTRALSNPFKRTSRLEFVQMSSTIERVVKSPTDQLQKRSHSIMLIDDEPDVLFVFKSLLTAEGYNIDVFADPQRALKNFEKVDPSYYDLVITDIRMSPINGLQLYEKMKAINPSIRVLFVSAIEVAEELIGYLQGVKGGNLIRKPVDRENLVNIVKTALT